MAGVVIYPGMFFPIIDISDIKQIQISTQKCEYCGSIMKDKSKLPWGSEAFHCNNCGAHGKEIMGSYWLIPQQAFSK